MSSYKSDKWMRKDEMSTDPKHVQVILWLASNNMQTPKMSMKISGYPPRKKPAFIRVFLRDNAGHHDTPSRKTCFKKNQNLLFFIQFSPGDGPEVMPYSSQIWWKIPG